MRRDQSSKSFSNQLPPGKRRGAMLLCKICRKQFWVKASRVKRGKVKFCSNRCRGLWIRKQHSVRRKCKYCKKWFSRKGSLIIKPGLGKFCSHGCLNASMKRRKVAVCKFCQKVFDYIPSEHARVFCSTKCAIEGRRAIFLRARCGYCGTEFEHYSKVPTTFCSPVCRKIACNNRSAERAQFKPSYIQFLLEYKGAVCPFVNCGEPTIERKGWCACRKHVTQILSVLSCKKRYRDNRLQKYLQETELRNEKEGKSEKSRGGRRDQTGHASQRQPK